MTSKEYDALEEYAERYARHKGEYQDVHINVVKRAYMDGYMRALRNVQNFAKIEAAASGNNGNIRLYGDGCNS